MHTLDIWKIIQEESQLASEQEPMLASFYHATILNHHSFADAISFHLANKLDSSVMPALTLREIFVEALWSDPVIEQSMRADIVAHKERDPACTLYSMPFLFFKGYQALQSYRVAHWLWRADRKSLALFFQNKISQEFSVDIHPAAQIGQGIMLDHATGIVMGETVIVENNVSFLHGVTLGGSGILKGQRHPIIREGVLIGVGAKILGDVEVGANSKIGAGSVVLDDVEASTTVAGVPAKKVGSSKKLGGSITQPAFAMDHRLDVDHQLDEEAD